MLSFLLGLLPGAVQISNKIADLLIARQQAKTDVEKAQIDKQIQQLNAQRDVLVSESKSWSVNSLMRVLLALGPAAYLLKYYLWDKTIGAFWGCVGKGTGPECSIFTTDGLDNENYWWVVIAVVGFYMVTARR